MKTITLVTSNPNKKIEAESILTGVAIETRSLDVPEIQSFDLEEIVRTKVEAAHKMAGGAVIVDDVSMDIHALKGFPGPFVKYWEKNVGHDLSADIAEKFGNDRATVSCGIGYADGERTLYVRADISGRLVTRRGGEGFGFDFYFIPDGHNQTFSEMGLERKNQVSHRRLALDLMHGKLQELGLLA